MDVAVLKIQLDMRLENLDHGELSPPERVVGSTLLPRGAWSFPLSVSTDLATLGDGYGSCSSHVAHLILCALGVAGYYLASRFFTRDLLPCSLGTLDRPGRLCEKAASRRLLLLSLFFLA